MILLIVKIVLWIVAAGLVGAAAFVFWALKNMDIG